jgi:hypothetical protein
MPETRIDSSAIGDHEDTFQDYSVDPQTTDAATDQKETTYFNTSYSQQLGYYKKIPELKTAIDALARWTIGKGFSSNEITEMALSAIKGHGKDTFNTILENQTRVAKIAGDSYAEIIRDTEGNLINLKPLTQLQIVANRQGLIIRYEQLDRHNKKAVKTFTPDQIFHLSRNRTADEIHGESLIDAVEEIILMRNEAMADYKKLLHRNIYPVRVWHLDTDDTTEIATFKDKVADAKYKGEDIFIPKGAVETELSAVPTNATLDPKAWIQQLNQNFYEATGVPRVVTGGSQEFTEASAKIAYLAFEQTVEEEQLYIEEQVLSQLNLEIELEFPATLQNELLSDTSKSETMQATTPEDTSVTNVGLEE